MSLPSLPLNEPAWRRCDLLESGAEQCNVAVTRTAGGTRIFDCGAKAVGSLEVGRMLAEICLADLGRVEITTGRADLWPGPAVTIRTDQPVLACMASQYAGWQVTGDKYFAMGSGPMRAAAHSFSLSRRERAEVRASPREPLFEHLGVCESAKRVVGVLETSKLPPDAVCASLAEACGVSSENVTLLVARTASLAGTVQVVARTVETALHKLHTLEFDLSRVVSGFGAAPLPPVAKDDVAGIGRTNDAVLYGGEVTLWVRGDDESLADLGPRIPSSSSSDHGQPFGEIFERYGRDFYKIDPLLFSPAVVTLINLDTGRSHRFGELRPDVLERSFIA